MQVEQIDRKAAAAFYGAWGGTKGWSHLEEPIREGLVDDNALVQSFARHRQQARAEVVGEIVAWLEEMYENCESIDGMLTRMDSKDELAKMMQAKFGGRDGNE